MKLNSFDDAPSQVAAEPPGRLRGLWQRVREPSLVRRLVSAQMVLLLALWTAVLGLVVWGARHGDGMLANEPAFDAVLAVAADLDDRPERQQHSLYALDRMLHNSFGSGPDAVDLAPTLLVWRDDQLVYRSRNGASPLRVEASVDPRYVTIDGKTWLAHSRRHDNLLVTFLVPDAYEMVVTLGARGYYLLPLMVSLPFLIIPAWVAVRIALRPWRELSAAVAARGPGNLSPLAPVPAHRELRPLVQALNGLLAQLAASTARERNLIGDAAHQLRTPLAALHVGIEALGRYDVPGELKNQLQRTSSRAARLVDQLLRLMRSDASQEGASQVVGDFDFDAMLRERLAIFDTLAHAKGIELEYDGASDVHVRGEQEGLEALIDNLVDNAIKYSPPGAVLNVVVGASESVVRLEVMDRGPGIDEAWHERVFDRFFRAPDQSQNGSGLGLAIVHSVVQRHGGQVILFNRGGGGLCVRVDLPRAPVPGVEASGNAR